MKDLKVGDIVQVIDNSWAVRLSSNCNYFKHSSLVRSHFNFKVVEINPSFCIRDGYHDIVIASMRTNQKYLHSSSMVKLVKPKTIKLSIDVTQEQAHKIKEMLS